MNLIKIEEKTNIYVVTRVCCCHKKKNYKVDKIFATHLRYIEFTCLLKQTHSYAKMVNTVKKKSLIIMSNTN